MIVCILSFQSYIRTSTSDRRINWKLNVSGRKVKCEVVDTSGGGEC